MKIDKVNSGALFRNDRKEQDTHPDYKGSMNLNGEQFWVNGWINTTKKGDKYLAIRVNQKQEKSNGHAVEINDEIPF